MFSEQSYNNQKRKSFWKRPEGYGAMILLILAAVGVFMFLPTILSTAATILASTVAIVVSISILSVFFIAFSDKKFRTAVKYFIRHQLKKIGGIIVETNPIAILKGYVDDLHKKLSEMREGIRKLDRQIATLKVEIDKYEEEMEKLYNVASQAKRSGNLMKASTDSARAEDIKKLLVKYVALRDRMAFLKTVLQKMEKYAEVMIQRISSKVELKEKEFNMVKTSHGVITTAWGIIRGGTAEKQLFDQAWEYMAEQTEFRVMEMESMLHGMQDFMDNIDLENAANMEQGLKSLEDWEKKMASSFEDSFSYLNAADDPAYFAEATAKAEADVPTREKVRVSASNESRQTVSRPSDASKYFN